MPTYAYQCLSCETAFDRKLPLKEYKTPQECPECGGETKKLITVPRFNLTGDGWQSKNQRVRQHMAEKNRRLKGKEEEMKRDAPGMTLAPNVGGERVENWSEAKKLAKEKGLNTSSYDPMIRKEKELQAKPKVER